MLPGEQSMEFQTGNCKVSRLVSCTIQHGCSYKKEIVSWISHLLSDRVRSAIGSAIMSLTQLRRLHGNKWFVHIFIIFFFFVRWFTGDDPANEETPNST